ncbi:glycosyltransferase family 87 protein [Micromonospora chaiyaphumensis]|uniref:Alpha-1,2-mannosyltransferase n=1 Tax=Micromonospora chaiyaphumensis TaxID=307119 RepID=A0A1C4XB75_9ACTN|nr:glycosyltransferase family 87 protein [Micromonospora chaiyaphumensis]SCF05759.1 alpha-1,2-mannosyltransferase [Micromonospora chaiyaphumensis]
MIIQQIRRLALEVPAEQPARPRVRVPNWLLVPGLASLAVSLAFYGLYLRDHSLAGTDFRMYLGATRTFLDGDPVYRAGYTGLNLPYTYPPVTMTFLIPLTWLDENVALYVWSVAGLLAMLAVVWLTTRMTGYEGVRGRLGVAAAVLAVLLWTEPLQRNFHLGQINIFVMLLVVVDLALPDRSRFKGIGIGAATATKLLPGLFVVYLLLTRRIRAAVVAAGTFAGLTLLGAIIQPRNSFDYWVTGRAFDNQPMLGGSGPRYAGNQSLQGLVARQLDTNELNTSWWMLSVVVVAVAGLALATALQRNGEEAMALVVVGCTMLLISPVSWSHYWLWTAPMAVVLIDVVRRSRGVARVVAGVVAVAATLPFLLWPGTIPTGETIPRGLIWNSAHMEGRAKWLAADSYSLTVLVLFALAALWLVHRRRAERAVTPAADVPDGG